MSLTYYVAWFLLSLCQIQFPLMGNKRQSLKTSKQKGNKIAPLVNIVWQDPSDIQDTVLDMNVTNLYIKVWGQMKEKIRDKRKRRVERGTVGKGVGKTILRYMVLRMQAKTQS